MKFFDFSTVYTAILTCNVLLSIISLIINNEKILVNAGYKLVTIFIGLTAIRFLLPIEVPFSKTVALPKSISHAIIELYAPRFYLGKFEISIFHIVILIWIFGMFIQSYRILMTNHRINDYVQKSGQEVTKEEPYASIIQTIYGETPFPLKVYLLSELKSPLIHGLTKPCILLPSNLDCTEQDLYYILKHEISHYKHHDLFIKAAIQFLTIVYWWNPFCFQLSKQTNLLLEMRIDDSVAGMSKKEIVEYLDCLIHMAEFQDNFFHKTTGTYIAFTHKSEKVLTKRFNMLINKHKKRNKRTNTLLIILVGIIYLFSYLLIFEADYFVDEAQNTAFRIEEFNSYLINNQDGTYYLFYNNICIDVLNSLDYIEDSIPVYTREEYEQLQQSDSQ